MDHCNEDDEYFSQLDAGLQQQDKVSESEDGSEEERRNDDNNEDEDEDPLDAYMNSLENNAESSQQDRVDLESSQPVEEENVDGKKKAIRLDIDEIDDIEASYYKYVEKAKKDSTTPPELEEIEERQNLIEYDKDGNILSVKRVKREIEPLPVIDHSKIDYPPFKKIFYVEHDEIAKLNQEQSEGLRSKLEIKVSGDSPPKPVCSFAHFKFDQQLMRVIRRSEYTQPTPIQAQAIPATLLGRNIIGIAMTGSGKTAAYLWPMIVHIMGQPNLKRGDGPIALVLVPTRELALQVYSEAKKFSNSYKIAVVCAYGGGSKYEQSKDLEAGAEIVVATPGRVIDLIKLGSTNLRRVTYLVLDEADRFFDMGFEAQVRSICDQIRPDRQTLLFSATFKKKIEMLARTVTTNPIKIVQKELGEANEDVSQHMIILSDISKKWPWFTSRLVEFTSTGSVLVFVTRIVDSEELYKNLQDHGKDVLLLHGDMEQAERNRVITSFKRKEKDIMIATDVAARGLDIAHVRVVVNYDVARDIDTHIHRIGRTGRAGTKGDAYTLLTDKDQHFAGHLVKNLQTSNQKVDDNLMALAMQSHTFRKAQYNKNKQNHHWHNQSHKRQSYHGASSSNYPNQSYRHHHNYRDLHDESRKRSRHHY